MVFLNYFEVSIRNTIIEKAIFKLVMQKSRPIAFAASRALEMENQVTNKNRKDGCCFLGLAGEDSNSFIYFLKKKSPIYEQNGYEKVLTSLNSVLQSIN
ncbi:hypothetical protein [Neobacillus mesonae]|uniref:hypothetical protein n=1 Tax=Neobacillus mesonae TaxID=1193713 RepID=UPI002E1C00BB|nr:hypothetical protein [Neobacillus mesonae]